MLRPDAVVEKPEIGVANAAAGHLNDDFSDIVVSGAIEKITATAAEVASNDNVDLPRIRLHFDRRHLGRLRLMVDRLNAAAQDSPS